MAECCLCAYIIGSSLLPRRRRPSVCARSCRILIGACVITLYAAPLIARAVFPVGCVRKGRLHNGQRHKSTATTGMKMAHGLPRCSRVAGELPNMLARARTPERSHDAAAAAHTHLRQLHGLLEFRARTTHQRCFPSVACNCRKFSICARNSDVSRCAQFSVRVLFTVYIRVAFMRSRSSAGVFTKTSLSQVIFAIGRSASRMTCPASVLVEILSYEPFCCKLFL